MNFLASIAHFSSSLSLLPATANILRSVHAHRYTPISRKILIGCPTSICAENVQHVQKSSQKWTFWLRLLVFRSCFCKSWGDSNWQTLFMMSTHIIPNQHDTLRKSLPLGCREWMTGNRKPTCDQQSDDLMTALARGDLATVLLARRAAVEWTLLKSVYTEMRNSLELQNVQYYPFMVSQT